MPIESPTHPTLCKNEVETSMGRIAYIQSGTGSQAIIMLTGWPFPSDSMIRSMSLLANGRDRKIFSLDYPGIGDSEPLRRADYKFSTLSKWILSFLDQKGIQKTNFVTASLGGAVAMHFAIEHPDRVEKVVAFAPPIKFIDATDRLQRLVLHFTNFVPALIPWFISEMAKGNSFIYQRVLKWGDPPKNLDHEETQLASEVMRSDPLAIRALLNTFMEDDLSDLTGHMTVSVKILVGEEDSVFLAQSKKVSGSLPVKVIPGANHIYFYTHPKEWSEHVDQELQRNDVTTR